MANIQVRYRTEALRSGASVFYRQAGDPSRPALLLLHGFPASSFMFRELLPRLADRFHVIAPDLPGFGHTMLPEGFAYTFAALTDVVHDFIEALELQRFALYVFDYGAPVGFRLAVAHPERITALITQNGNAYAEGLSDGWNPIRNYWDDPSAKNRESLRAFLEPEAIRMQYTHGADAELVSPDGYTMDSALLARPGQDAIQMDLLLDYATNIQLYPEFQRWMRERQPPVLAIWGRNDPFFLPAGAEAFRRDLPAAEVHLLDTGHFALETHAAEIAERIEDFLSRHQ